MTNFLRGRIGRRIAVIFCALVLLLVGGGGWILYRLALDQFERQMADHLVSVSLLIAEGLDGEVVGQIDPQYGLYDRLQAHLERTRLQVGAARIAVFDREGLRLLDTRAKESFGQAYARVRFDRDEIDRVWHGEPAHSVAFYDETGVAFQTGYAPLYRGADVVAAVAVDLGEGFVGAVEVFQKSVYILAVAGVFLTFFVGIGLSKILTRPIARLVDSAHLIGQGHLDQVVEITSKDELGELGKTLDVMRQQLGARDEQLRQMLAGVAHEIRNPLGGIELYAGFIADDLVEGDSRRDHILKVIAEVRNLNQVISDFLMFARPAIILPEQIRLRDVISDALFLLAPEMDWLSIKTVTKLEAEGRMLGDGTQLKGAVVNVLKNATQAMPEGGTLTVHLKKTANGAVVRIIDTGQGIAPEDKARIFDPFFTTKEQGSGLGLPIVQQILTRHQARLDIQSERGSGTTVIMAFERVE
jgi:signal transduction histidine kinase